MFAPSPGDRRGRDRSSADNTDQSDADPLEVARSIVLRKLDRRAHSRRELSDALSGRGVPDDVATELLDRFVEVGLIDDVVFAEQWSESRQRSKHLSRRAIELELRGKGIDLDTIAAAFTGHGAADELSNARALAQAKVRALEGLPLEVARRRLAGRLARKGFAPGVVWQVVGEILGGPVDE